VCSCDLRLAGGPVGTPEGRRAFLTDLTSTYRARLIHFTSIPGENGVGGLGSGGGGGGWGGIETIRVEVVEEVT
jgi:hypothetical protein